MAPEPLIRTPLTELFGHVGSNQANRRCRDLELNLMDCLDAYGRSLMMKRCKDEYDDYNECIFHTKQLERIKLMKAERKRQYKAGERSKEERYAEPPKLDSYQETYQNQAI